MNSAHGRLNIAQMQLTRLGEPQTGESAEVVAKRAHYQQMFEDAQAEIAEAQRASLPYREDDD